MDGRDELRRLMLSQKDAFEAGEYGQRVLTWLREREEALLHDLAQCKTWEGVLQTQGELRMVRRVAALLQLTDFEPTE